MQVHRVVSAPVLDPVLPGERRAPVNPNAVDRSRGAQIDHHPLGMSVLGFGGEMGIEIRITFPKRFFIAVRDAGIAVIVRLVDRVSASRQTVAVGKVNRLSERIVRGPVSTLMSWIAPRAARVPMPDFAS